MVYFYYKFDKSYAVEIQRNFKTRPLEEGDFYTSLISDELIIRVQKSLTLPRLRATQTVLAGKRCYDERVVAKIDVGTRYRILGIIRTYKLKLGL